VRGPWTRPVRTIVLVARSSGVTPEPDPARFSRAGSGYPVAFILSSNINRRHMTKGQRAMAVALIYPEPAKGGRGKNSQLSGEFSVEYLSRARAVVKDAPEQAVVGQFEPSARYDGFVDRCGEASLLPARPPAIVTRPSPPPPHGHSIVTAPRRTLLPGRGTPRG
jgi:hypothetical protein